MAVITGRTEDGLMGAVKTFTSNAAALTDSVELPIDFGNPHVFVGVQMFNSIGVQIVATNGTFLTTIRTVNTGLFESVPTLTTIDATAPDTISAGGNINTVRVVVGVALTGNDITTWKVVATANRT